jgi:CubicO group peptidase (beta-lactamase class C family)
MDRWLGAALDYVPQWLDFQMAAFERPGCCIAVVQRGKVIHESAYGFADLGRRAALTPRHRFRVASHSKSFTAAGILRLREAGRLKLDDAIGAFVTGLHPKVAETTIQQVLSHSAGLRRDMPDAGYFADRRPFPSDGELMAELRRTPPLIEPNTRFKYSNVGYALLGRLIEAVTGERYADWIRREVVAAAGLGETAPDMPLPKSAPLAKGHSGRLLMGRRVVIPCDQATGAFAPVGGFDSTAADLARFFDQLMPAAAKSILAAGSRREMIRRQWRDPYASVESHYGLGIISGRTNGWEWFGHSGGLQGFITRTAALPGPGLTVSVLANSVDGLAGPWLDGIVCILQAFARHGPPARRLKDWRGRWWGLWGAVDLLAAGNKVFSLGPGSLNPFMDAAEIAVTGRDKGLIVQASGYGSYREPVRLVRDARRRVVAVQFAGSRVQPAAKAAAEIAARYGGVGKGAAGAARSRKGAGGGAPGGSRPVTGARPGR